MGMIQMATANSNTSTSVTIAAANPKKRYKLVRFDINFDAAETGDPQILFGSTVKYNAGPFLDKGGLYGFNITGQIPYDKLPVTDFNEALILTKSANASTYNVWYEEV